MRRIEQHIFFLHMYLVCACVCVSLIPCQLNSLQIQQKIINNLYDVAKTLCSCCASCRKWGKPNNVIPFKKSEYKCTIRHRVHVPCPFGLNKKHNNNTTMPLFRFHFFCLSSTLFRIVCVCLCVCICLFVDVPCSGCLLLKGKRKFYALHVISFLFRSLA